MPTRDKITFISRQDNKPSLDFILLKTELQKQLPDYRIVCKCRMVGNSPGGIVRYMPAMLVQMYHIATSRVVILDSYCIPVSILRHKPKLRVIQLWHAMGLMKKAGYASVGSSEGRSELLATALCMHRGYTHILVSSPQCERAMLEVFGYVSEEGEPANTPLPEIIVGALPRMDWLQSKQAFEEVQERFCDVYPELLERRLILYAPTARQNDSQAKLQIEELIAEIEKNNEQGESYTLLVKMHPLHDGMRYQPSFSVSQEGKDAVIFDESFTAAELAMIADACVSDYSSMIYEFLALRKPTYFFAFDIDEYLGVRGLFIDYEREVPGPIFREARTLLEAIRLRSYSPSSQVDFLARYITIQKDDNTAFLAQSIIDLMPPK